MKAFVVLVALLATIPDHADSVKLSSLAGTDMAALVRGASVADGACALEIIEVIDAYGGKESLREFSIDFVGSPIVIKSSVQKLRHECANGVHTEISNGRRTVVQRYDDEGNPTMMDDNQPISGHLRKRRTSEGNCGHLREQLVPATP